MTGSDSTTHLPSIRKNLKSLTSHKCVEECSFWQNCSTLSYDCRKLPLDLVCFSGWSTFFALLELQTTVIWDSVQKSNMKHANVANTYISLVSMIMYAPLGTQSALVVSLLPSPSQKREPWTTIALLIVSTAKFSNGSLVPRPAIFAIGSKKVLMCSHFSCPPQKQDFEVGCGKQPWPSPLVLMPQLAQTCRLWFFSQNLTPVAAT